MPPVPAPFDVDLLVIGAGPTGLTAACEALRQGLSVRIVDRKAHRSTVSKALVMHARTLEALEDLQLSQRLVAEGARFEGLNVRFGKREPVRVELGALGWTDTRYPFWLSIPQYATERCLEERLGELGGAVGWRTALESLEQDVDGVTAVLRRDDGGEERCRARWMVGADGGRSRSRDLVGLHMDRESLDKTFVLADVKTTCDLEQSEGHGWRGAQGLLLLVPMPEPDVFRLIAHVPNPGEEPLTLDADSLDALILARTGMAFGSHDVTWSSQFELSQGLSDRYRAGRVFLAGDAAHVHSPVGGQGMNTGIQDAHNLVWKLALARDIGDAAAEPYLQSYEQERRPVAAAMVRGTGRATRALTNTHPLLIPLLGFVGSRLAATERVRRALARTTGMLDVAYPDSAILGPAGGCGTAPGHRVPNPELGDGLRLHDLLEGQGHTLLSFGSDLQVRGADGDLRSLPAEVASAAREALGLRGEGVLLVRPDRCVAGCWADRSSTESFGPAQAVVG